MCTDGLLCCRSKRNIEGCQNRMSNCWKVSCLVAEVSKDEGENNIVDARRL
jgi:hypothetical protein